MITLTTQQTAQIKAAQEFRTANGNSPKSFADIPQGGLIAATGTAQGSQNVFLFGTDLVCVALIDGRFGEITRTTPVTDAMKEKYTAMYTAANAQIKG